MQRLITYRTQLVAERAHKKFTTCAYADMRAFANPTQVNPIVRVYYDYVAWINHKSPDCET